jgi:hypothetical protein
MQMERIEQAVQRSASLRGARTLAGTCPGVGDACGRASAGEMTE